MSFIAEYTINSPMLKDTHEAVPEMRFEMEDLQLLEGTQPKYVFWATGGDFDRLETVLGEDPYVISFSHLTTVGQRRLYRLNFTQEAKEMMTYPEASRFDIVFLGATSTTEGVHFRTQVPTRDALSEFRRTCEAKGLSFSLDRIYQEGDDAADQYGLTDRQREALVLAHERGYYGPDREVSLAELAAELDISRQAFADRLRRGLEKLLGNTVAGD
jgi:predicted DNA binding protein